MVEITGLRARANSPGRIEVEVDGRRWRAIPAALAQGLGVGMHLARSALADLETRSIEAEALQAAGRFLARRPHSVFEARRRLERKGYAAPVISTVIDRLLSGGDLDDTVFARAWVENRMAFRPRSAAMLRAELRSRGVARADIETALTGLDERRAADLAARRAVRRWSALEAKERRRKTYDYLARRGFAHDTIRSALKTIAPADRGEE